MLANKIVKLEQSKVYEQINKYLEQLGYKSKETQRVYSSEIKAFFKLRNNKQLEHLTVEDVQLTLDDFEDFVSFMYKQTDDEGNRKYTNKTLNKKISAIKGVTEYLASKKIVQDVSYFPLIKHLPETKNQYGVLEAHEVFDMAELAFHEREKGAIKRLLILFALDTCVRKTALLAIKWTDFVVREDDVLVKGVDKGNKDFRHIISKDFYNELLTIKTPESDKVFDISDDAVQNMFTRLKTQMNLQEERNLVFHSIRKAGVSYRYRITGDILEAKRAAGHSNSVTTEIYIGELDYGAMGAVSAAGKLDMESYKKVDKDVLIEAISMCKKDFQVILNMKIAELMKKK
jgi:integrase